MGETSEKFPPDKMAVILEFGVSHEWQSHVVLQNFDPLDNDPNEFVEFCERLEETDRMYASSRTGTTQQSSLKGEYGEDMEATPARKSRRKKKNKAGIRTTTGDCGEHGLNCGHTSDQCWVLHPELHPNYGKQSTLGGKNRKGKNQKVGFSQTSFSTEQTAKMNAAVAAAVKVAVAKQDKKRKRRENVEELQVFRELNVSDDSSDSDKDDSSSSSEEE